VPRGKKPLPRLHAGSVCTAVLSTARNRRTTKKKMATAESNPLTKTSRLPLHHCLSSDISIPLLGFGTYLCSTADAETGVKAALDCGYRHIDTAEFYNNHEGIANAIAISDIPREDLFITDKISPGGIFTSKMIEKK